MSSILLSLSLSMFAVAQALTSITCQNHLIIKAAQLFMSLFVLSAF